MCAWSEAGGYSGSTRPNVCAACLVGRPRIEGSCDGCTEGPLQGARRSGRPMTASVEGSYPHVARWVTTHGWIELGQTEHSASLVRALDVGGLVWEGATTYRSLDKALQ